MNVYCLHGAYILFVCTSVYLFNRRDQRQQIFFYFFFFLFFYNTSSVCLFVFAQITIEITISIHSTVIDGRVALPPPLGSGSPPQSPRCGTYRDTVTYLPFTYIYFFRTLPIILLQPPNPSSDHFSDAFYVLIINFLLCSFVNLIKTGLLPLKRTKVGYRKYIFCVLRFHRKKIYYPGVQRAEIKRKREKKEVKKKAIGHILA